MTVLRDALSEVVARAALSNYTITHYNTLLQSSPVQRSLTTL
jgi:hypothetical protein